MLGQESQTRKNFIISEIKTNGSEPEADASNIVLYQAVSEHLCCDLNGEAVILSLKNGKYYGLNLIGAEIWNLIQKPIRVSKIVKKFLSEFDVDEQECLTEVESFLSLMKDEGLVEIINVPVKQIRTAAAGRKDTIY